MKRPNVTRLEGLVVLALACLVIMLCLSVPANDSTAQALMTILLCVAAWLVLQGLSAIVHGKNKP